MTDLTTAAPATEPAADTSVSAATPDSGSSRNDIASDLRQSLAGTTAPSETPKADLRDGLRQALEAASKPPSQPGAPETPAQVAAGQPRQADGKFAAKPADAPQTTQSAAEKPTVEPPPAAWSKAVAAKWAELPAEVRVEISKREADVAKGFAKYQGLRVVEPILDYATQVGQKLNVAAPVLVESWARIQHGLLDPATRAQTFAWLQTHYPTQAPQQAAAPAQPATKTEPAWVDPEIKALNERLASFENWKTQQEQERQAAVQRAQQEQQQHRLGAVEKFGTEKGADGQPLRPHLDAVSEDMAALIGPIRAANPNLPDHDVLQQAYDRAVWGNPDLRAKMLDAQRVAQEKEAADKARARAQAAARAAVSPASASPQGPASTPPLKGDLRSQMAQVYQQLQGS